MDKKNNIPENLWEILNAPDNGREILESYSDNDLRIIKDHLTNIKNQSSKEEPDWDNLWNKVETDAFSRGNGLRKIYGSLKYAAAVIVLLGVSFLAYYIVNNTTKEFSEPKYVKEISIDPGTKSAKLILADGKSLELSKNKVGNIIENKNVVVSNDSSELLAYKPKESLPVKLEYNTIVVPRAGEYSVRLSDGTVVYLNSETELRYPVNFIGKERRVYLKGEAYFKVKRNTKKPFRVQLEDMSVEVLGTSFNINSYAENNGIRTTLVEGKVKVFDNKDKRKSVILKPNQQAEYKNNELSVRDVDVTEYVSWKDGKFYFKDMTLEKVMIQMERWYGINVFFVTQDIKDYPFTGVINKMYKAEEIFKIIEKVTGLHIRQKGKSVYIEKR